MSSQRASARFHLLSRWIHPPALFIDDQEIIIALDLWIAQSRVGPEIPQPISDEMMIRMIDLWVRGADCRSL